MHKLRKTPRKTRISLGRTHMSRFPLGCDLCPSFSSIQGEPSGLALASVEFDLRVPPCCWDAMPILTDLQLPLQNWAHSGSGQIKLKVTKSSARTEGPSRTTILSTTDLKAVDRTSESVMYGSNFLSTIYFQRWVAPIGLLTLLFRYVDPRTLDIHAMPDPRCLRVQRRIVALGVAPLTTVEGTPLINYATSGSSIAIEYGLHGSLALASGTIPPV